MKVRKTVFAQNEAPALSSNNAASVNTAGVRCLYNTRNRPYTSNKLDCALGHRISGSLAEKQRNSRRHHHLHILIAVKTWKQSVLDVALRISEPTDYHIVDASRRNSVRLISRFFGGAVGEGGRRIAVFHRVNLRAKRDKFDVTFTEFEFLLRPLQLHA